MMTYHHHHTQFSQFS